MIKVLWKCSRWPGGTHWYAAVDVLNPDEVGVARRIEHDKFVSSERALMWIEREFKRLGEGFELWDWQELIHGVPAMRDAIRKVTQPGKGKM